MSVVFLVDLIISCGLGNKRSKRTFLEGDPLFTIIKNIGFIKKIINNCFFIINSTPFI